MFDQKKKYSQLKQCIFMACSISGTTNRQKFGGDRRGIPSKIFSQRICTNWGKTPKYESEEATCPFCPPPPSGGATGNTHEHRHTVNVLYTVTITTHFCTTQIHTINSLNRHLAQLLSAHAIGAGDLRFELRVGQISTMSPTARHRCDVPSELCSQGAKPRRWVPPLVTRFGEIPRVQ